MYLSLLKLSREQIKALKVTDTYSLHRIVYTCFEKTRTEMQDSSGILFTEVKGNALEKNIIILSQKEPCVPYACHIQSKEIPSPFFERTHYRFEVTINPVKRENATRKLIPMRSREDIIQWFCSRTEKWGFYVQEENIEVADIYVDTFRKENQTVTLGKATIKGILKVENHSQFLQAVSLGLGRGKAFGCGLLQLNPISF